MNLIAKLASNGSKIYKEQLLIQITELEYRTFAQAYDPYYVYHMKFAEVDMHNLGEPIEEMFKLLDSIISRLHTGHKAKVMVETFAEAHGDLIKLVINKDLRCGVTATTFNKVHPGAVPQFKVQLAKAVPLEKLDYPVLLQIKYDGVRLIVLNKEGEVKFFTRNGKEVMLPYIKKELEAIPMVNYMLDTEVTLKDGTQDERTKISGMINSAMHGGLVCESDMMLNCFDFMTLSDWEIANCADKYDVRFTVLLNFLKQYEGPCLRLADTQEAHSKEAVDELYNAAIDAGFEGLILKHASHLYTFKRSKDWVKLKEVKTADLVCRAVQAGEGKYKGFIGALFCDGIVEGKQVEVSVGSGLKDIERSLRESHYMWQTIEVKYNAVIQDSVTGKYSLFLPRYVCVRFDK